VTKKQQWGTLAISVIVGIGAILFCPSLLNDSNSFLKSYVTHEMFAVFAGFAAISLPVIGLYLDRLKNHSKITPIIFAELKSTAQRAAKWICGLLALCFFVVYLKGFISESTVILFVDGAALINFFAVILNVVLIMVLYDVVSALLETY
jgi:hypothetical protein